MSRERDSKPSEIDTNTTQSERKRSINNDDHSPKSATLKRPRLDLQNKEFKDRGKRMLGMIFNTLNQFKKDTNDKSEAEKRREEIENKLQERLKKEKKDLEEEIKQDDEIRRKKRIEEEKERLKNLKTYLNKQNTFKINFIKTKSTPHIYYLPAVLNDETKKLLEEQKIEASKTSLNTELFEVTSPLIPTPISARTEDSKSKSSNILDKKKDTDNDISMPSTENTKEDTKLKKSDSDDNEERKDKIEEDDNEEFVDKISNEDSKMSNQDGEDDDQDLKIDDAMDEVQY
ncbi:hypothetical protein BCR36DRAFT_316609 [Piromyces finnis]|uniref:Pinin/SDK/MemA protein domain-containing protein n=1 Tax=Piromyces finnis TaxID=1754191 RepID=A0A1Y1VND6_9FUNG|nr:hypothetical protein BCR36DRAFT_316609 [Piromyces finnis]|eukprot:ORX60142.1 hypothetical protein BCR36DRAFT_316609 [Piromyces finnis]